MADTKSNLAIWKIDPTRNIFDGLSIEQVIERVVENYNLKEQREDFKLNQVTVAQEYQQKQIRLYSKKRISFTWSNFVNPIYQDERDKNELFQSINKDFILFIYDAEDIFVLTAGAGYFAIQTYIDDSFPLQVSKKLFKGDFKYAEVRDLVGEVYSKSENYRRSYSYSRSEAFGKVWKKLYGEIDSTIIENSPELSLVLDHRKKINAEMKSSFTFRKSVTLEQIVKLVNAIQALPTLSDDRKEKFKYLDTLSEVKAKRVKQQLEDTLLAIFYQAMVDDDFSRVADYDFCHPENVTEFLSGCDFQIGDSMVDSSHAPTSVQVFQHLRSKNILNYHEGIDEFKKSFDKQEFSFKQQEGDVPIETKLRKYFHGEVVHDNKNYFYVDGKWYQPVGSFFDYLLEDLIEQLFDRSYLTNSVPLMDWQTTNHANEGQYNEYHRGREGFYFGDKYYVWDGRGKVELFDLLYATDSKLYIIQVKNGFAGSVRDAVSQLEIAADVIEESARGDRSKLREYYQDWHDSEKNKLTEDQFAALFTGKERVYVMACAVIHEMTRQNFENGQFPSKIAQFETLALCHSFRIKGRNLEVQYIQKN